MDDFTYNGYRSLLNLIRENGYRFSDYFDDADFPVILRHDVDNSLEKAAAMAKIDREGGVKSTFFILLTGDFYNAFSARGREAIGTILECGHEIGLHFDETHYPDDMGDGEKIIKRILGEADVLSFATGKPVRAVSMHRPSGRILESDLQIPGIVNTYGSRFFREYKYLSDSRRRWREPVRDIIASRHYDRIQMLVHPFSYTESEIGLEDYIFRYVNHANAERYEALDHNFTDLEKVMQKNWIMGGEEYL